jgi:hypothetical protein
MCSSYCWRLIHAGRRWAIRAVGWNQESEKWEYLKLKLRLREYLKFHHQLDTIDELVTSKHPAVCDPVCLVRGCSLAWFAGPPRGRLVWERYEDSFDDDLGIPVLGGFEQFLRTR